MRQLLARDNRLIVTDLNVEALTQVANEIRDDVGKGEIVACIAGDLSHRDGVDTLWEAVDALGEPIDILVNNAGIAVMGRHEEVPQDAWERLMEVNLLSPMRLSALVAPQMIARRDGHIVNIASLAGWMADDGLTAYAASKFGLRGFSETLSNELRERNVRVSAVYPFFSNTPILNSPRFGSLAAERPVGTEIPGMTQPADVIREVLAAVEKDRLHIFPDRTARALYRIKRYAPRVFEFLRRRIDLAGE